MCKRQILLILIVFQGSLSYSIIAQNVYSTPSVFYDLDLLAIEGSGLGPVTSIGLDRQDKNRPENRHLDILSHSFGHVGVILPNVGDFGGVAHSIGYEKRYQLNIVSYNRHSIFLMTGLKGNLFLKNYTWLIDQDFNEINPEASAYEATVTAGIGVGYRFSSKNGITTTFTPVSAYWGYADRNSSWKYCEYATPLFSPELLGGRLFDLEISVPLEKRLFTGN